MILLLGVDMVFNSCACVRNKLVILLLGVDTMLKGWRFLHN